MQAQEQESPAQLVTLQTRLTVGQIVNYVLPDGRSAGQIRPAIVVRVWSDICCNLQVFVDGDNDYPYSQSPIWITSSLYSEEKTPRSWHYWSLESEPVPDSELVA